MRFFTFFLFAQLVIAPCISWAQFTDDFSDGDFTNNPTWSGDTSEFTIFVLGSIFNEALRLDAPAATDVSCLSTPSQAINSATWTFYVEMNFNPSGSNFANIYLTSDATDLTGSLNGYFVKVGGTDDEVSLYVQSGTIQTEIIDGQDDRVNYSPVTARIQVTRDDLGNWELMVDTLGGTDFVSEGTVFDDTHIQSQHFGVLCDYTSTRSDKFYFDDFIVTGTSFLDTFPPSINSVNVISTTALDVIFNESIEKASAESTNNYSANNGIGNPTTAVRDPADSSIVHLTFGSTFQNCIQYSLTVDNVEDLSGNPVASTSETFISCIPDTALPGDVIINEIFPDPTPRVGLPEFEFLELYNKTNKAFDLTGWTLSGDNINSVLLLPNEYLILCSNSAVDSFAQYGNVTGVSSFGLTNSGATLTLANSSGQTIDEVSYSDSWYRDADKEDGGWSIERIDPDFPCETQENWAASTNQTGGTPAAQNSIIGTLTDSTAPEIISAKVVSNNTVQVTFNETPDNSSLNVPGNYTVDNGIGNPITITVSSDLLEITLTFSASFDSSTIYNLTVLGITDCIGNVMQSFTTRFALPHAPQRHDILMTEILADPEPVQGLPPYEFVELYNNGTKTITLSDLTLSHNTSDVTLNYKLLFPSDYVILCDLEEQDDFRSFGDVAGISFPSLTNSGAELTLTDNTGEIIHFVEYSDSWYRSSLKRDGGFSLEMVDLDNPCSGTSNWRDSEAAAGGTPGVVNSVNGNNVDEMSPALLRACVLNPTTVALYFDEYLDPIAIDSTEFSITPQGLVVTNKLGLKPAFNEIRLTLSDSLPAGTIYKVEVNGLADCTGNLIGIENSAQFGLPEPVEAGDFIINEVLFNPPTGGIDFVELYNTSDKILDLIEVTIGESDPFIDDSLTDFARVSLACNQILPKDFALLTSDPEIVQSEYHTENPKAFVEISGFPNYPNDEGIVLLLDTSRLYPAQPALDKLHFYEDWHFDLLDDEDGVSLERISYDEPTQSENNWHSAASTVGFATPAYENSHFGTSEIGSAEISLEPDVFSPNNDGYRDFLNINYHFDQPGYVLTVKVFNDAGRDIRTIGKSELPGAEGVIRWDGVGDNGDKAPVGIYIVIAEVFNLNGDTQKFKNTCVLTGKY